MHLLLYTYWVSVSLSCVWLHGMRLFELRSHWRRLSIGTPVCADETSILPRVHLIPLPLGMLGLNMKLIESITALLYQDCKAVRRYHHGKWRRVLKSDCLSTDSVSLQYLEVPHDDTAYTLKARGPIGQHRCLGVVSRQQFGSDQRRDLPTSLSSPPA